ncbi:restriction endonuclease subunit S [Hafnia alvei]|uniref:restriction endonuclease subunit S n=1 Tax=Hafnia alvei TaxID=569 RepID=UPI000DFB0A31|nr:restriction endonuclease subunit S [Hafnia alvei]STQ67339.1 EcoKI restriction-modification system protein HsdS [Hafnia alvei]
MGNKWDNVCIDDIKSPEKYSCVGGPFGSSLSQKHYVDSGIPVIRGVNLAGDIFSETGFVFVSQDKSNELCRNMAFRGDLVFTQRGTLGQVALIPEDSIYERYIVSQSQMKLTVNPQLADSYFIYTYFRTNEAKALIEKSAIVGGVPHINLGILKAFKLRLPPLFEQKRISEISRSIDNKIILNRQINQTLEQMAQALFKSWFVDFDPVVDNALDAGFFEQDLEFSDELLRRVEARKVVRESADFKPLPEHIRQLFPAAFEKCSEPSLGLGGWVPEGWKVKILGEITSELRRGISPKYIEEGGVQVINQKCIRNHEVSYEAARRHDQETKRIDGRALKLGDVLVNSTGVGTLGRIAQVTHLSETTVADSHVTVVRVSDNACPIFTFGQLMLSMETLIERLGEGSTGQTELSRKILSEQFVVLPPSDIAEKAERSFKSFSEKQESNRQQNSELIKLRDTLLPKLISGELRLSDSEVDTAEEVLA